MMTRGVGVFVSVLWLVGCSSGSGGGGGPSDAGLGGGGSGGTGGGSGGTGGGSGGYAGTSVGGSGGLGGGGTGGSAVDLHCENNFGDACTCIQAGGGNEPTPGVTCSPSDVGGGYCCTDSGYPGDGICQCSAWGCNNSASLCSCGTGVGTDSQCDGSYLYCCVPTSQIANPTYCSCSNLPCNSTDTEVTSCGIDIAGCTGGRLKVDSCTP